MAKPVRWPDLEEAGFELGMRVLFWLYRHRPGFLKLALQPVILYYFVTSRMARESSLDYLHRLQRSGSDARLPAPGWRNVYRHLSAFAQSTLDKLGVWADPQQFANIQFHSKQLLLDQLTSGKGAILLGAHLGNMEICHQLAQHNEQLKLNVLVHTKHADMFNKLLRELNMHHELKLIEVSELSPVIAIRLSECVRRGEFIAILADRIPVASRGRSQTAIFLGAEAHFPEGPFILAALLKCPTYTLFCTRKEQSYVIRCEKFADRVILPRNNRSVALAGYIQKFADVLEKNLRETPMQWFNFYPFWNQPS